MPLSITRRLEFDAGHRIPNHHSKCKNIHGHRYVLEATVTGPLVETPGASEEGMVVDFSMLKALMNERVVDVWDHSFLCWERDHLMIAALKSFPKEHRTILLPCIPTVENLVHAAWDLLHDPLASFNLDLVHLRLYETPNCWAEKAWINPIGLTDEQVLEESKLE